MNLSFNNKFILKGKDGQEVIISSPYLNDERELELKYCSFYSGKVFLNEERKALELRGEGKTVLLLLRDENESLYNELAEVKKQILSNLRTLTQDFQTGKEIIYAIELEDEHYPFLITSPTALENSQYSIKYNKAIMYFINDKAKKVGKKIELKDYEEMLQVVGQAINNSDLTQLTSGSLGSDKYYSISIDNVVELL